MLLQITVQNREPHQVINVPNWSRDGETRISLLPKTKLSTSVSIKSMALFRICFSVLYQLSLSPRLSHLHFSLPFPSPNCPVSKNPIKIVHSNTKNCSIRIQTRSFHSPFSSDHSFIDQMLLDNKNNKIQIKFEMKLLYVIQIIIILLYVL